MPRTLFYEMTTERLVYIFLCAVGCQKCWLEITRKLKNCGTSFPCALWKSRWKSSGLHCNSRWNMSVLTIQLRISTTGIMAPCTFAVNENSNRCHQPRKSWQPFLGQKKDDISSASFWLWDSEKLWQVIQIKTEGMFVKQEVCLFHSNTCLL